MEHQQAFTPPTLVSKRAEIVTTRPFLSVKEAVAIFSERSLAGNMKSISSSRQETVRRPIYEAFSPPASFASSSTHFTQVGEDEAIILGSLKKLEDELKETKHELMLLKKREFETEKTVASLNAELAKSMSKLADIETVRTVKSIQVIEEQQSVISDIWEDKAAEMNYKYLPTFSEALSLSALDDNFGAWKKPVIKKKKPIVPLIGDLFSRKKVSNEVDSSIYSKSFDSVLS